MAIMKTSNPALGENTFRNLPGGQFGNNRPGNNGPGAQIGVHPGIQFGERFGGSIGNRTESMTLNGTINKTGILLICTMATAAYTWYQFLQAAQTSDPSEAISAVTPYLFGGMIGGLIFALITIFKKEWSPITAPAYALLEGLVLGGLSAVFELRYPGIAVQAVGLTFGVLFAMLFLYRSGLIKVTDKLRLGIFAATGGIALFYLLEMVLSMFHINFNGPNSVNGNGIIGIGFSLIVVGVAALNLVLDFDFIEKGVQYGAPKYMEWYGAFGIMVTLIWLYLEMLRLLSKFRSRN
jgi:uncharacterized YccA/Bax inhibitor family protein